MADFFYFHIHDETEVALRKRPKEREVWYSRVFGPFESHAQARGHMTEKHPNDHAARFLLFQAEICSVAKNPLEKPNSEKRVPDPKNWSGQEGVTGSFTCNDCKAVIQAVRVAHPVHDGPFPLSGSGECEYTEAGYCPNCDAKPSPYGHPVSG